MRAKRSVENHRRHRSKLRIREHVCKERGNERRPPLLERGPERREVLSLRIWEGFTFAEIGEVLELSPNTAASRYRAALADLRRMLEGSLERR